MELKVIRDKTKKDTYMCCTLLNMFRRGELRKDHPLQRKSGRWKNNARDGFIATVIKHEDVDSIKICEQIHSNNVTLWLIDGIQRLTTLENYRNGLFKLGKNLEEPIVYYQVVKTDSDGKFRKDSDGSLLYDVVECDLRGKAYKDLPVQLKECFDNFQIDVVKHLDCTDKQVGYHIRRYNRQSTMNANETGVTYMDEVAKYVKPIADNNKFFKDFGCYKETEKKNSVLYRIVAESVMAMFYLDDWKKRAEAISTYLSDHATKQQFDILNENLNRLQKIVTDETSVLFNTKNSFIWFALFERFKRYGVEDKKFGEFLYRFKNDLCSRPLNDFNNNSFKEFDTQKATKDKRVVIQKLNMLETLLKEFLGISGDLADEEEIDVLDFVRQNVNSSITQDDFDDYYSMLDVYDIDKTSKLLDWQNEPSLISLIAYSFINDIDLDDWIRNYFKINDSYLVNQKDNFLHMKQDLNKYLQLQNKVAV